MQRAVQAARFTTGIALGALRSRAARHGARARRVAAHLVSHLGQELGRERDDLPVAVPLRLELSVDRLGQDPHGAVLLDERFGLTAVSLILFCLHVLHTGLRGMDPQGSPSLAAAGVPRTSGRIRARRYRFAQSLRQDWCVTRVRAAKHSAQRDLLLPGVEWGFCADSSCSGGRRARRAARRRSDQRACRASRRTSTRQCR